MSHASRVKDQAVIARRKSDRKREQRRAGVPAVIAKIRGTYTKPIKTVASFLCDEKTLRFGERVSVSGNEIRAEFAKLHPELLPAFRPGASVRHASPGQTSANGSSAGTARSRMSAHMSNVIS